MPISTSGRHRRHAIPILRLAYVMKHADTPEKQQAVIDALIFKCDVLWAMLDALAHAYGEKGNIPPGAFNPEAT